MNRQDLITKLDTLSWYCVRWVSSEAEPCYINIMNGIDANALYECLTLYKTINDYAEFYKWVRTSLRSKYHFKAEHEMLVRGIKKEDDLIKIDVWEQIAPNISIIVDYLNTELGLNFKKDNEDRTEPTSIMYME